jgi:hypothetical protein
MRNKKNEDRERCRRGKGTRKREWESGNRLKRRRCLKKERRSGREIEEEQRKEREYAEKERRSEYVYLL